MDAQKIKIGKTAEFSADEITTFKQVVTDAGEVYDVSFDGLMEKNPTLMCIQKNEEIIATGALKIPNDIYKESVFSKSKSADLPNKYKYELGWIVSTNEGKGNCKKIVESLIRNQKDIYATVREDNTAMRHILEKNGFILSGNPYKSSRGNYNNVLYLMSNNSSSDAK